MLTNIRSPTSSQSSTQPLHTDQDAQNLQQNQGDTSSGPKARIGDASKKANDGEAIMNWFDKLFDKINVIAGLGAGFMFQIIVDPPDKTKLGNHILTISAVHTCIAASWLFFVLAITCSSAFSSIFDFYKADLINLYTGRKKRAHITMFLVSLIVQLLVLAGFLAASLVVMAFSEKVGFAAIVLTAAFALGLIGFLLARLVLFFCGR